MKTQETKTFIGWLRYLRNQQLIKQIKQSGKSWSVFNYNEDDKLELLKFTEL